jgi:8-oxo-dGTP pyrophosphatase MutT (NUDIX family)
MRTVKQVACGVMFYKGKILMGLRPNNRPYGGFWEFPGGSLEKDETIEECLKREWLEELNLDIVIDSEIHQNTIDNYYCRFFVGYIPDISNMKKNIHEDIRFVDIDEAKNSKMFDGDYEILTLSSCHDPTPTSTSTP